MRLHSIVATRFAELLALVGVCIAPTLALAKQPAATQKAGEAEPPALREDSLTEPTGDEPIPLASPHAAAVETPSAPEAWGGVRTGKEATLSDRVVRYELRASLDPSKHTLEGSERVTWRNRSNRPVKSLYVHLYLNAFEGPGSTFATEQRERGLNFRSSVSIGAGEWGHIELKKVEQAGVGVPWEFVHPDGGPETDHTVVRFDLPAPVPPGASTTIDVDFRDQLPRVVARTGYFGNFHMVAQWFPKLGVLELPGERGATTPQWNAHEFHMHSEFYADWGDYDVRITVPEGYQVASAGEEQGAAVIENGSVTRRFVQGDIHDFAWMTSNDFAPPLEGHVDVAGSSPVTVKVFYPPEYVASAAPALKATIDSITYFSETLGPYPYRTSTCIIPPFNAREAGGMEYQTIFTAESYDTVAPGTANEALLDFVTIHEFGHGYFYGLLASNEFEEPLLDEGLNEYWDMRMLRARGQSLHMTTPFWKTIGFDATLSGFELERLGGGTDPHPPDPIGQNSWDRLSSNSYGSVYSRTATVMHDLEERIGREAIERAFKAYYATWHFRHPSVADFRESMAEASGQREAVERVFRQNVYAAEAVDDRVESLSSEEIKPEPGTTANNNGWVEITQSDIDKQIETQRTEWKQAHPDAKPGEGPFLYRTVVTTRRDGGSIPQSLVVTFQDGTTETKTWDDDARWHRFTFVTHTPATSAQLDPEAHNYLDTNKLNDGLLRESNGAASRRWSGDVAAVAQAFFALVATL